jgi:hypothetical protein
MPISSIYKAEKFLKENGVLTIEQDPNMRRDQETGLILQNRSIDLNKIGLDEFVVLALDNHEGRIQDIESNMVSRDEVKNMMEKFKDDLLTKILAKEN